MPLLQERDTEGKRLNRRKTDRGTRIQKWEIKLGKDLKRQSMRCSDASFFHLALWFRVDSNVVILICIFS